MLVFYSTWKNLNKKKYTHKIIIGNGNWLIKVEARSMVRIRGKMHQIQQRWLFPGAGRGWSRPLGTADHLRPVGGGRRVPRLGQRHHSPLEEGVRRRLQHPGRDEGLVRPPLPRPYRGGDAGANTLRPQVPAGTVPRGTEDHQVRVEAPQGWAQRKGTFLIWSSTYFL